MPTFWEAEYERRRADLMARLVDAGARIEAGQGAANLEADLEALVNAHAQWQREIVAEPDLLCRCGHGMRLHYSQPPGGAMLCHYDGAFADGRCSCLRYEAAAEPALVRVPRPKAWADMSPDERGTAQRAAGGGYRPLEWGPLAPAPKLGATCWCRHSWMEHSDIDPHACRQDCGCVAYRADEEPRERAGALGMADGAAGRLYPYGKSTHAPCATCGGRIEDHRHDRIEGHEYVNSVDFRPILPGAAADYGGDHVEWREPSKTQFGQYDRHPMREPGCADCSHGRSWHTDRFPGCQVPIVTEGPNGANADLCGCSKYRWPSVVESHIGPRERCVCGHLRTEHHADAPNQPCDGCTCNGYERVNPITATLWEQREAVRLRADAIARIERDPDPRVCICNHGRAWHALMTGAPGRSPYAPDCQWSDSERGRCTCPEFREGGAALAVQDDDSAGQRVAYNPWSDDKVAEASLREHATIEPWQMLAVPSSVPWWRRALARLGL